MMVRALEGQVAVVTGGGSGVGRAIALELAQGGMHTVLVGRTEAKLQAVKAEIEATSHKASLLRADLADDGDLQGLGTELSKRFSSVAVLVHNAGVVACGAVASAPVADFDYQYRVNLRAPYVLTQQLLPSLVEGNGQIVFINSTLGVRTRAEWSQYAATKHGLKALADSLRDEVNGQGIRVFSVMLGRTATPMQEALQVRAGKEYRPETFIQPENVARLVRQTLELERSGEVTDIYIRPMIKPKP